MKFTIILLVVGAAIGISACSSLQGVAKVNTSDGRALRGFDAVAYFAVQNAVEGNPKYEFAWNGARWLFSSEENMKKFQAEPEKYAPQFGGYCAYAVSQGYTADGDPNVWKIVDGKLYLNYNEKARDLWEKDLFSLIESGTKNWAGFQTKKPEHKG
jgi:YHS domain-containing protein